MIDQGISYATNTKVSAQRTRVELETLLEKAGATKTAVVHDALEMKVIVFFEMKDRRVRFWIPLPNRDDIQFTHINESRERSRGPSERLWEQACRSSWRALLFSIKAKLVSISTGVETFEQAFLAHIVVPGGTVGDVAAPAIAEAYRTGLLPPLFDTGRMLTDGR